MSGCLLDEVSSAFKGTEVVLVAKALKHFILEPNNEKMSNTTTTWAFCVTTNEVPSNLFQLINRMSRTKTG